MSSGSAESELSQPALLSSTGSWSQARPPLQGLTDREGRCFLFVPVQPQPPNSVGIISQMFLRSASSLCSEPRSLLWLGRRASLTWSLCPAPLGSYPQLCAVLPVSLGPGPHPCLAPFLPSPSRWASPLSHCTWPLRSSPGVISMHLLRTPGWGSVPPPDFIVFCLELLSHYSDVASGSPRLSSFIFMHLGLGTTPS